MTDTFAGISPRGVALFIAAQLVGGALAAFSSCVGCSTQRRADEEP